MVLPAEQNFSSQDEAALLQNFFLPSSPDEIPLEQNQRLVALGDIHGNITKLRAQLQLAGVLDKSNDSWCGKNTICVQVGDILDRGCHELECWMLLCNLAQQAEVAGGRVVVLWGNHEVQSTWGMYDEVRDTGAFEAMFGKLLDHKHGDMWRSQHADFGRIIHEGSSREVVDPARWASLRPGGLLARPLLSKLKVAVKVGKTILVHGGLDKEMFESNTLNGISEMNKMMSAWICTPITPITQFNIALQYELKAPFPENHPFWMRDLSYPADSDLSHEEEESVSFVLKKLHADRLVVGHTQQSTMNSALNGAVWRIDLVQSSAVEVLEVMAKTARKKEIVRVLSLKDRRDDNRDDNSIVRE